MPSTVSTKNNETQIRSTRKTLFQRSFLVLMMIMKGFVVCISPSRKRNTKRKQLVPTSFSIVAFDTIQATHIDNIFDEFSNEFLGSMKIDGSVSEVSTKVKSINSRRQIAKKAADLKIMEIILMYLQSEKIQIEYSYRKKTRGYGSTPRIKNLYLTQEQSVILYNFLYTALPPELLNHILECYLGEMDIDLIGECFYHMIIEGILDNSSRSSNPEIQTIYPYCQYGSAF